MKRPDQILCARCLRPLRPGEGFPLDMNDTGSGSRVVIRWHDACHEADPLAEAFADADRAEGQEGAARYLDAIGELWLRTPEEALRGVIDVRRDARPPLTLRGPQWGLVSVR